MAKQDDVFDVQAFWKFCSKLRIDSKEDGAIYLTEPLGTQRYAIERIFEGLNNGIHWFTILKGRQQGITTILQALDLYWLWRAGHEGMTGTMLLHEEEARDAFRTTFQMFYDSLPNSAKRELVGHNRNQMVFRNRARFMYRMANTRQKGKLGRGTAITFMHATECGSYQDESNMQSIIKSLAESNPKRLYVFESTANGYNLFHKMWEVAKESGNQMAIFVPWWKNEKYVKERGTREFEAYWDGQIQEDEKEWVLQVERLYGHVMTPEQMAYWRWNVAEQCLGDLVMAYQEMPPHEMLAFQVTGSAFFDNARLNDSYLEARDLRPAQFKVQLGTAFHETQLMVAGAQGANLSIWEEPVPDAAKNKAFYILAADPAYGSSDWADRFAIQVFRAYADCLDQVAEFCTPLITTAQFAWVIAYLAGAYGNTQVIMEVNGPGQQVLLEFDNLKKTAMMAPRPVQAAGQPALPGMSDVYRHIFNYTYKRVDSVTGSGGFRHWQSNANNKARIFNAMRDYFMRGMLKIRSLELLEEMKSVVQDGSFIGADTSRGKDDLTVATALACAPWSESMMHRLAQMRLTRASVQQSYKASPAGAGHLDFHVQNYLRRAGIRLS